MMHTPYVSTLLDPDLAIACPGPLCHQPSWPSPSLQAHGQCFMGACDMLTVPFLLPVLLYDVAGQGRWPLCRWEAPVLPTLCPHLAHG